MSRCSVTFKGTVNGLTIIMRESDSFKDILENIEKKISSAGKFFKGSSLSVKYRGKKLSPQEEKQILDLLIEKSGADIKTLEEDDEEPEPEDMDMTSNVSRRNTIKKFSFFKGIDEGITKFYRGTVRSGQLLRFDGNIVVLGDVNPGGVIEATGNVIVLGSLRGVVHAGCDGNKEAIVAAFNLQPTQLRIADVITRPPDDMEVKGSPVPELAFIKDDMVYIDRFLPQYK